MLSIFASDIAAQYWPTISALLINSVEQMTASDIPTRKIIHIDMDCFYAAIEMRDNPTLRDRPLAVGGDVNRRGVLCTCNYLARSYGVRSAMPTVMAYKLCPDLIVVPPNISYYKTITAEIHKIFSQYTTMIEPLSLDEAFLDVTDCKYFNGSATWVARAIREQIENRLKLTASAGIACNKFLAKVASEWHKPNGQFVITPEQTSAFVSALLVNKIPGVGKVTAEKLNRRGIYNCADLHAYGLQKLIKEFGKFGHTLFQLAQGHDDREVNIDRECKSVSAEETYAQDLNDLDSCLRELIPLNKRLQKRLQDRAITKIKTLFVKVKFADFTVTTAECSSDQIAWETIKVLCAEAYSREKKPVRLLGVGVRLIDQDCVQAQMELPIF